jgi:hypothetical protein
MLTMQRLPLRLVTSDAGQGSQSVIGSPAQGLAGLGEQRGEDDPSDARQGSQNRHVALLGLLPRRCFRILFGEPGAQAVELAVRLVDLPVHQLKPFGHGADVRARRLGSARRYGKRGLPQDAQHYGDPPDAMRLDDAFKGALADARGFLWRRCRGPQFEKRSDKPGASGLPSRCR